MWYKSYPNIRPLFDDKMKPKKREGRQLYLLRDQFDYEWMKRGYSAKKGFITDLGSVPKLVWWYVRPDDPKLIPGFIAHDDQYNSGRMSREDADMMLRRFITRMGVRSSKAWVIWKAVRYFGASNYRRKSEG